MGSGDVGQTSGPSETLKEGKMEFLSHTADSPMLLEPCMAHTVIRVEKGTIVCEQKPKSPHPGWPTAARGPEDTTLSSFCALVL